MRRQYILNFSLEKVAEIGLSELDKQEADHIIGGLHLHIGWLIGFAILTLCFYTPIAKCKELQEQIDTYPSSSKDPINGMLMSQSSLTKVEELKSQKNVQVKAIIAMGLTDVFFIYKGLAN